MSKVIAVDFEGIICERRFPAIGPAHMDVLRRLIEHRRSGGKVILWTCRTGQLLADAVAFCHGYGLDFDAVNENLPESKAYFGEDPRKIWADEYWDDRNVVLSAPTCESCKFRKSTTNPRKSVYSWCANNCKNFRRKEGQTP